MKNIKLYAIALTLLLLFGSTTASAFPVFLEREPQTKEVPVIMYHLVTKNSKLQGKFGISPEELEEDLKYLKENGYEAIFISDLIDFVGRRKHLPEKPVILTFDDGLSSDYDYLLPLLDEYDAKAVSSIVVKLADEYTVDQHKRKPHLEWSQIEELYKSKNVEIQNHSYDLHGSNGSGKNKGEAKEFYQERLSADLKKAQEEIKKKIGAEPTAFTYPLGVISKEADEVLKSLGFKASLSCREGVNLIKQDEPDCLFNLKRNVRRSGHSVSEILQKIEKQAELNRAQSTEH